MIIKRLLFTIDKVLEYPVTVEIEIEATDDVRNVILQVENILKGHVNKYKGL